MPTKAENNFTDEKGKTLGGFAYYFLCEGQQQAEVLGYSPLPINLVKAGLDQVRKIPGVEAKSIDITKCNNPTFSPDGSNTLARTAKQPPECDRKGGPTQCATGTGGAPQETPTTGSGTGGDATTGAAANGGAAAATDSAAAASGGSAAAVYDSEGNLISGGEGAVAGVATALPFTLASAEWGWQQSVMLGSGAAADCRGGDPTGVFRHATRRATECAGRSAGSAGDPSVAALRSPVAELARSVVRPPPSTRANLAARHPHRPRQTRFAGRVAPRAPVRAVISPTRPLRPPVMT